MLESPFRRIYRRFLKPGPIRRLTAADRALPDFLLIGAMRAGTTTLHDLLCRHPQVVPAIRKEIHYYDLFHDRGERWYRAHFPRTEALRRTQSITGEASPYYLFHPLAPGRVAGHRPETRIIAILRHPVDRAYSHYWHVVRNGLENLSFEDALAHESDRLAGELDRIRENPGYTSGPHQHFSYRTRSIYADQIPVWLDLFGREQVLVLEQRQFFQDIARGAARLFSFLELDPVPLGPPARFNRSGYPGMNPNTRAELLAFYAPHNARLFEILGESFDWQA